MIRSFLPTATVFTSNGEKIIQAVKCIEHRELGDWYIDLVAPLDYKEWLQKDYILVVETKEKSYQPFRINNPKITSRVEVRAYHIGFDTRQYAVELSTVINDDAQACLDELDTNIDGTHPFTFTSSIATLKSFSVVDSSLYDALVQIADEYNGYLDFDGWNVSIASSIGADRGVVLAYGKNIQESEVNENWDLVVTKLKPIGNNGILLTPAWLTADVSYDRPYTKIMNFDTDNVTDLGLVAQLYLDRYKVPRVNYKVKADVEQNVGLGDAVVVNARQFTTTAEVLSFDYNVLTERVTAVEFGNFRPTLKNYFSELTQQAEEKAVKRAQVKIDETNAEIDLKVNADGIISAINLSPELIKIVASKIALEGLVTVNDGFEILLDGSIIVNDGTFKGSIDTAEDATIGINLNMPIYVPSGLTDKLNILAKGQKGIRYGTPDGSGVYPAYITIVDDDYNAGTLDPVLKIYSKYQTIIGGQNYNLNMSSIGLFANFGANGYNLINSVISEYGTNASGENYIKYANGYLIKWKQYTLTIAISTAFGNIFLCSEQTVTFNTDIPFISAPNVFMQSADGTGNSRTTWPMQTLDATTQFKFQLARAVSQASQAWIIQWFAIGRWA